MGGLLLGAWPLPGDFEEGSDIGDERLRWVLDAAKIAHGVTGAWPVDLDDVADELGRLGVLEQVGGITLLISLIESYDERVTRARELVPLHAALRLAEHRVAEQALAEDEAYRAVSRYEDARERADAAIEILKEAGA